MFSWTAYIPYSTQCYPKYTSSSQSVINNLDCNFSTLFYFANATGMQFSISLHTWCNYSKRW